MGLVATGALSIWLQLSCLLAATVPAVLAAVGVAVGARARTYALVWGLVLSRFGLWSFDLAANQLIQETVEQGALGTVNGVQGSMQSLFQVSERASQYRVAGGTAAAPFVALMQLVRARGVRVGAQQRLSMPCACLPGCLLACRCWPTWRAWLCLPQTGLSGSWQDPAVWCSPQLPFSPCLPCAPAATRGSTRCCRYHSHWLRQRKILIHVPLAVL